MVFRDRVDAGRRLAQLLADDHGADVVVLALPRGGVPVAVEVASALHAPLDVVVVRKLGVPGHREYAMGALGEDGVRVLDGDVIRSCQVSDDDIARIEAEEQVELARRAARYRRGRTREPLMGRTAILVDDGMATGSTALAAAQVARQLGAGRVILAVPVASDDAVRELRRQVEEVVAVEVPERFRSVGEWYDDFAPTTDDEVVSLLCGTRRTAGAC